MKIVLDTNVLISGLFFGNDPKKIITGILNGKFQAYGTLEIFFEYERIFELIKNKLNRTNSKMELFYLIRNIKIIKQSNKIKMCRDPDDDKFINCAINCKALYIVSGDKDLLDLKKIKKTKIISVKDFCKKYLR